MWNLLYSCKQACVPERKLYNCSNNIRGDELKSTVALVLNNTIMYLLLYNILHVLKSYNA